MVLVPAKPAITVFPAETTFKEARVLPSDNLASPLITKFPTSEASVLPNQLL